MEYGSGKLIDVPSFLFIGLQKGKRRLVEVGKWFRLRYENFLNDTYTRRQTRVDSSSRDRCIMSTQCLLYGLYPAVREQIWTENEKWQPIPVYAIPESDDNVSK